MMSDDSPAGPTMEPSRPTGQSDPPDAEAYLTQYAHNQRVEGRGFDTAMVEPCPFCAAPAFRRYRVLDVAERAGESLTCATCGRSAAYLVTRATHPDGTPGLIHIELVQTGGPEPPEWMELRPRRVEPPLEPSLAPPEEERADDTL